MLIALCISWLAPLARLAPLGVAVPRAPRAPSWSIIILKSEI